jgi:hypothetical protein
MALLFLDSFDHYDDATEKYASGHLTRVPGRHGQGMEGDGQGGVCVALTPSSSRVIVGMAVRLAVPGSILVSLSDIDIDVCDIRTHTDGSLSINMGVPEAFSVADLVRVGQWHYLEADLTVVHDLEAKTHTLSSARLLLDGAEVLTTTNLGPTIPSGSLTGTVVGWTNLVLGAALPNAVLDDVYVCDGSGPAPHNAPLGDVQIDVIRPNGVGAVTEWTPVGAETNWGAVRDPIPDADATTVTAATAGVSDLYQMEDIDTDDGVIGAQILIAARRTEEGFATLAPLLRHAGTTTALVTRSLSPTYFYRNRDCFVTMPNGDPLTDAHVNALQAGMRRIV